jgi:eukaryotic-like serine/threonine-protein kinase
MPGKQVIAADGGHGDPMSIMSARLVGGRYQLHTMLGRGGTAAVWAGIDTRLDRSVAVKLLDTADGVGSVPAPRFGREAHLVAGLAHPNIVAMYDAGTDAGVPYLVMELVEGEDLQHRLAGGRLDPRSAVDIAVQVCAALEAAHGTGVVHRDIKPGNIMLTWAGVAKVCDFGIAGREQDGREQLGPTRSAVAVGTSEYMAPEQATGSAVDARTDLYALGCVLYATLTGGPPFAGADPARVLWQQVNQAPEPMGTDIPADLATLVVQLLAKDPADRPVSAREVRTRLSALTGLPDGAPAGSGRAGAVAGPATARLPAAAQARAAVGTITGAPVGMTRAMPAIGAVQAETPERRGVRIGPVGIAAVAIGAAVVTALIIAVAIAVQPAQPSAAPASTPAAVPTTTAALAAAGTVDAVRAAVQTALQAGQLSASVASDLSGRLNDIERDISRGRTNDAAQLINDLRNRLVDRHQNGAITDAGYNAILTALNRLAATVPATFNGNGNGNGGNNNGGNGNGDGGGGDGNSGPGNGGN